MPVTGDYPARPAGFEGLPQQVGGYAACDGLLDRGCRGDDGDVLKPADLPLTEVFVVDHVELAARTSGLVAPRDGEMDLVRVDITQFVEFEGSVMAEHAATACPQGGQHVRVKLRHRQLWEPVDPICDAFELPAVGELAQLDYVDPERAGIRARDVSVLIEGDLP